MVLEEGAIAIVARIRVQREEIESLDDVQRMLWVLTPDGGGARRVIVVGRKRLTKRFWAFVDDGEALLGRTQTLGAGTYAIEAHEEHAHFDFELHGDCFLCGEIGIPPRGSFIVSVMNPDPARWPSPQEALFDAGAAAAIALPFPPALQERFGEHRYLPLAPEFLQYAGAELVFVHVRTDAADRSNTAPRRPR
ncbi:MAG TPA: hypothetical protein VJZ76_18650 [Thermoanaerobaculia bacterium]|nr:hypothetical protein [Thermoanaerobaculia bacterium]